MQQCRADGLIDPDAIPGTNIHPAVVEDASRAFTKSGTAVASGGTTVKTKWGGLAGSYETPDSAQLLSVMDSVVTDTASLSATMTSVAKAISTYASAIEPVVAELKKIQGEARTFVAKALKGVTVGPWDPNHPANRGISGLIENFGQQLDHVHIPWDQYQPYIDDNNDLLTRVAAQETKLSAASADCVNAINGLRTDMCIAQVAGVDYTAAVKANQAMPWGTTGRGDQNCSQKFDSGMDDALQGTLDGLGGLIGYNAQTGKWGDGDWAGKSWLGFAESLGAIVLIGSPPVLLAAYLPKGWVPDVVRETALGIVDKQKQIVEGFVGTPEDWANDPAHAAGGLTFNVGTLFIPGAGEVGAGAKVASIAAKVGTIGADGSKLAAVTGKVAAAATTVVRVGSALNAMRLGVSRGLVDAMQSVRTDLAKSLHSLADRIPAINVTVEQAAMPGGMHVGLGHPRIEVEPGGGGQWLHSVADHVGGDKGEHSSGGGDSGQGHSSGGGDTGQGRSFGGAESNSSPGAGHALADTNDTSHAHEGADHASPIGDGQGDAVDGGGAAAANSRLPARLLDEWGRPRVVAETHLSQEFIAQGGLGAHEGVRGAHTLETHLRGEHGPMTDQEIAAREDPGASGSSAFRMNENQLNRLIGHTLDGHAAEIDKWLRMQPKPKPRVFAIKATFDEVIGRRYLDGKFTDEKQMWMQLLWHKDQPGGFVVRTAYPTDLKN